MRRRNVNERLSNFNVCIFIFYFFLGVKRWGQIRLGDVSPDRKSVV